MLESIGLPWDNHELLKCKSAARMRASVQHVHERYRQDKGLLRACEIRDVAVERHSLHSDQILSFKEVEAQFHCTPFLQRQLWPLPGSRQAQHWHQVSAYSCYHPSC